MQARGPWLIAALVLAIHGLVEAAGGASQLPGLYLSLGLRRDGVAGGSIWQILTYAWLHGSWLHALINALCIVILGARVEQLLGTRGFLNAVAAGMVGGAAGHLLLADGGKDAFPLVGISGAAVGLLLVITTLSPEARMFPLPVSGRSLGMGILLAELFLALVNPKLGLPGFAHLGHVLVAHGFAGWFVIGHACHVGGGVAGSLYALWWLRPRPTLARLRRERARREAKQRRSGGARCE
jgi:membrane associated rhomboid family serine protease